MIPMMSLYFPPNMRTFCKILVPLHGEPGFVPNLFQDYILPDTSQSSVGNYNFEVLGYQTPYFIVNAAKKITLTFAVLIIGPIFMGIAYLAQKSSKPIMRKIGLKIDNKLRW